MSILQKQYSRDPRTGYARDFVEMIARGAPDIDRPANPRGGECGRRESARLPRGRADAVQTAASTSPTVAGRQYSRSAGRFDCARRRAEEHGYRRAAGSIRAQVQSANVYFGAAPIAEALETGRADRHHRAQHRHRAGAGAHDPRIRMEARTNGTSSRPEPSRATPWNAARNAPAGIARWIGRPFRTWPTSATRSSKPSRMGRS